ncbi:hypothetical protein Tco_1415211, partial [Tanacetum coccineum]
IPSPPLPPLPSSPHLPPPVPTSLPLPSSPLPPLPVSLFIPPPVDHREDILEAELPPCKRLCSTAPISRYEVGESSTSAPRPTRDPTEAVGEVAPTTLKGVNARVIELAAVQEQDTQDIYAVKEDTQDRQTQHFRLETRLMQMIPRALNNMPPRRSSATARATVAAARVAAAAAAAPMTATAVEQLIEARGIEGVVVLSQWFENMESVFHISNCAVENQALKKTMTVKYCPMGDIKKLEIKLWNLKVKGIDVVSYTLRFQELALMCGRMFHEESEEVKKYVGGLPDMI